MRSAFICSLVTAGLVSLTMFDNASATIAINPAAGFNITWDGNDGDHFKAANPANSVPSNLSTRAQASPFASSQLAVGPHFTPTVNDGVYGNSNSWIGGNGDPTPTVGIDLGGLSDVSRVAWGRDNGNNVTDACGGQCTDRWQGVYTLQVTSSAAPQTAPNAAWTTVGTLDYQSADDAALGGAFTPWFRHEYQVSTASGDPIKATGVRLLVPNSGIVGGNGGGTAIDEIEVFSASPVPGNGLRAHLRADQGVITSGGGSVDVWLDQSGNGNDATPGIAPTLVNNAINGMPAVSFTGGQHLNLPSTGAMGITNSDYEIIVAGRTSSGAIQFLTAGGFVAGNENFELHLNGSAGARFIPNGFGGGAGASDIGPNGVFANGATQVFNGRVQNDMGVLRANGLESLDTTNNAQSSTDVPLTLGVRGNASFPLTGEIAEVLVYDRNLSATERRGVERHISHKWGGLYLEETGGGLFSNNVAAASAGATPFAQDVIGAPIHTIANLNDGLYGNSESWIGLNTGGSSSFAGVAFDGPQTIAQIAFGRDNGGEATQFTDRSLGTYTIQWTSDEILVDGNGMLINSPTWMTISDVTYAGSGLGAFPDTPFLRHAWSFDTIRGATGVRIITSSDTLAIDELEVLAVPEPVTAGLTMLVVGALAARRRRRAG